MLPFEKEFGSHVHVETMKKIIIDQKKRPEIPESWRANPVNFSFYFLSQTYNYIHF